MALSSGGDFPRGGKRSYKEEKSESKLKDLFQTEDGAPEAKKQKVIRSGKKKAVEYTAVRPQVAESLHFQNLTEGLLVLGLVKEIREYSQRVKVSLPGGLRGMVSMTNISQPYTLKLQAVVEAADAVAEDAEPDTMNVDVSSLSELFHVGEAVLCRVMAAKNKGETRQVDLSVDPREVNRDMSLASLKAGSLLYGAVSSVEEHGYMIDLGIPGLQAFLQADPEKMASQLPVGKCVWCTLQTEAGQDLASRETRVVRVSTESAHVRQAQVTPQMVTTVECLRPGMKVTAAVEKVLDSGLKVKCIRYSGTIHKSHIPHGLGHYKAGQKVEARILYTDPTSKIISLSLLPEIVGCVGQEKNPFADLCIGDVIEEAEVVFVERGREVYFKIQNHMAKATFKELSDEKVKDVNKMFPRRSRHKCRIIDFHPADSLVLVSLRESVMQQKFLSLKDIQPGQTVQGTVHHLHTSGLVVSLGKRILGLVPKLHVADVPLQNLEKKFSKGDKLKCRVLKVDIRKNRLLLSNKKSLVTTTLPVPTSYQDLQPGTQLEGYVLHVRDQGVVVSFCNDVKGWVVRSQLSTEEITHPASVFYPGQVVRCRVLSCHPETQRLKLSLIILGKAPIAGKQKMKGFEVGKLVEAEVVRKLGDSKLEVKLSPSNDKAVLPRHHLADSADNQDLLWHSLQPGHAVGTVMLFRQADVVTVTKKESFISASREGLIPKCFADLELGQLLPGVVKNHQTYGIFVELAGGMSGLVPRKFTMNRPVLDLESLFAPGQSVVIKVMDIKEENSRFLCSLRMCDCFLDDPTVAVELLETYLDERSSCFNQGLLDEKVLKLHVGSIVMVEVTKVKKSSYVCQTEWGMLAVFKHHYTAEAEVTVGTKMEAVVLHVDPITPCLEVSADRTLVRTVSRRAEKSTMDKARVGQRIKAQVVLVKNDFVLVALKQHAVGTLAFVPTKQHLNDVQAKEWFSVGEETRVIISKVEEGRVLANLESRIPEALAKQGKFVHERHDFQLGQVVTAQVQNVCQNQINVKIGRVRGRVHVTEVVDETAQGVDVFATYRKGQSLEVKIIGFRQLESNKYLPISHPRFHKAMPECTLKPSKMASADCPPEHLASYKRKYETGERILVFPVKFESNKLWVNVTPTVHGLISVFDLSRDLGVLTHADRHFSGQRGHGYLATVLSVDEEEVLHLSLTGKKEVVKENKMVTGKVTSVTDKGIFLRLPDDCRGCVPPAGDGGDGDNWQDISVGLFVRCRVLSCKKKEQCVLALGRAQREGSAVTIAPAPAQKSSARRRKTRRSKHSLSETEEGEEETEPSTGAAVAVPVLSGKQSQQSQDVKITSTQESRLRVSDGFAWEEEPRRTSESQPGETNSSSDEEEEEVPRKRKRKKTEAADVQTTQDGEKRKEFDRLLLSRPNDSMLWIEYMSEHMNAGDIDRARAVGEQALKTISFREEQEKLNVWIALLNLENLFGSKEQVTQTFQRAVQVSDPLTLFRRVAAMYSTCGKTEEAEQTYQAMVRKFKQTKQAWADFGLFLYKLGRLDAARNLLQRSLLSLQRHDHVEMICKFAQMEFGHGEAERGATMFQKIMAEFPRRSDILSVYIDMVVKSGDHDKARELLERAVTTMKNAQFFFKKYLAFEEKFGSEESVARVKEKIESFCS